MTTPTREQVVQWEDEAEKKADAIIQMPGEYHPDWHTVYAEQLAIIARADLEATVKEQAAKIERLMVMSATEAAATIPSVGEYIAQIEQQLAAAQLHIEQLRGALAYSLPYLEAMIPNPRDGANGDKNCIKRANEALSTQPDLSALEAERQRVAEACAKVCDQQKDECGTDTNCWYGAKWCEEAIRAGQWREHL